MTTVAKASNIVHIGNMLATCLKMQAKFQFNMLASCLQHASNMLATCWQHARNFLATCRQHAGNILTTCWSPTLFFNVHVLKNFETSPRSPHLGPLQKVLARAAADSVRQLKS